MKRVFRNSLNKCVTVIVKVVKNVESMLIRREPIIYVHSSEVLKLHQRKKLEETTPVLGINFVSGHQGIRTRFLKIENRLET